MVFGNCKNCGRYRETHGGGMCITCYKKILWKPRPKVCKRCKRSLPMHAKGLCAGCYQFAFHSDRTKAHNYRKWHGIDLEEYKEVTKECKVCGFNKIVELHHLDEDKENNSKENLIGLCPNHHKMFHDFRFREEIIESLESKGLKIPPTQN